MLHWHLLPLALGSRVISRYGLTLVAILFLSLPAFAEDNNTLTGTVTWIHDGDTIEVTSVGKVRLIGIDTPERENSGRDWYLKKQGVSAEKLREIYRAAKEYNLKHVKGKQVALSLDNPPRDKYGRLLAYVHLPDGRILNQLLLQKGLAVVYRKFSFQMKEEFLAAEEHARANKVGLWK